MQRAADFSPRGFPGAQTDSAVKTPLHNHSVHSSTPAPSSPAPRQLVLASASPRRQQLLQTHGYQFRVVTPPHEEPSTLGDGLSPKQIAEALSYFKARSTASIVSDALIIAGDTIATIGNRIFGKPVDQRDARRILSALLGSTHEVITGVTLLDTATGGRDITSVRTQVTMRTMSDEQMDDYLQSGAWEGKAGAYGIQDHGDAFVESIDGSFSNVVGFPMEVITEMLAKRGVHPSPPEGPQRSADTEQSGKQ